jgi:hypothetical protein
VKRAVKMSTIVSRSTGLSGHPNQIRNKGRRWRIEGQIKVKPDIRHSGQMGGEQHIFDRYTFRQEKEEAEDGERAADQKR